MKFIKLLHLLHGHVMENLLLQEHQ